MLSLRLLKLPACNGVFSVVYISVTASPHHEVLDCLKHADIAIYTDTIREQPTTSRLRNRTIRSTNDVFREYHLLLL